MTPTDPIERLRGQWTEAAREWIESDPAVREGMLDSWMLDALGDVRGKAVIDVGCGEGRFSRLLAELGAAVTGVDLTEPLLERACSLRQHGETYLLADAEDMPEVDDGSFDLAVSYIVLVDLLDYRKAISEAYRVLRSGGRFVVCNIHPMRSAHAGGGGWIKRGDEKLFYPLDDYTNEGPREFDWLGRRFVNMHRTISSYVSAFLEAGFTLDGIQEPVPSEEQLAVNPHFDGEFRAPNFIIFLLTKP